VPNSREDKKPLLSNIGNIAFKQNLKENEEKKQSDEDQICISGHLQYITHKKDDWGIFIVVKPLVLNKPMIPEPNSLMSNYIHSKC
jgi:hypothetical protein